MHCIHNATNGLLADLAESYQDLLRKGQTIVAKGVTGFLRANVLSRSDVKKVIVIAYSQGTIIMSAVLPELYKACSPGEFEKLEVYNFATCCRTMQYAGNVFTMYSILNSMSTVNKNCIKTVGCKQIIGCSLTS